MKTIPITYNTIINKTLLKLGKKNGWSIDIPEKNYDALAKFNDLCNKLVTVTIRPVKAIYKERAAVKCLGYTIAKASGRDSGAYVPNNITLMKGEPTSGGSRKNWATCTDSGDEYQLDIPDYLYKKYKDDYSENWEISLSENLNLEDVL